MELAEARYSVRKFTDRPIEKEKLVLINSVFSLRALGDIYWSDMPPTQEWWKRLSEVCKKTS